MVEEEDKNAGLRLALGLLCGDRSDPRTRAVDDAIWQWAEATVSGDESKIEDARESFRIAWEVKANP